MSIRRRRAGIALTGTGGYRLRLVIDRVPEEPDNTGYDLDDAQPWPLGCYSTERDAINARNALVCIDPPASGSPKQDKMNYGG